MTAPSPTAAAGCSASAATARTRWSGTASSPRSRCPKRSWRRNDLSLLSQRVPRPAEEYALYAGSVVVTCTTPRGETELAMSPSSLTGLQAWLEAGPPGSSPTL